MNLQRADTLTVTQTSTLPPRFAELKRKLIPQDEASQKRVLEAWKDIISQLRTASEKIHEEGSNVDILIYGR